MGKLKAENPQLFVYYNDIYHVTIILQTPHKLSVQPPNCYTLHKLRSYKSHAPIYSTCQPASTTQSNMDNHEIKVQIPPVCTVQSSLASPSMCVQISCTSIVTTDSHTALSPTSPLVSTETVHALQLIDVFIS